jgi:S-adenosyl methyltransferase
VSDVDWRARVSLDRPNVARMWDYFLGGYHNFAIDREAAERAMQLYPDMPLVAQSTRGFLRRVVQFMLGQGIEQFLDIGSGMPTVGHVHEVAQRANPETRVVYVDSDPVVIAHSEVLLRDTSGTISVLADARRPEEILGLEEVKRMLDWTRPIGVLAIAVFHFVPDDEEVQSIMGTLRDAVPNGSYVALTHATADSVSAEIAREGEQNYARANAALHFRTRDQVSRFFDGLELIDPGVTYLPLWRPESDMVLLDQPERSANYGGVGLKK